MFNALEIDFLPVGDSTKSGDAIALRFGTYESAKWKNQYVFVIDGGNVDSGEALINHVTEVYKTDKIDRVILTHPDGDHASGLRKVLEGLEVGKIWMHRPWNHWVDCASYIKDGRITRASFTQRLQDAYQYAYELEQITKRKKIEIYAPHQGWGYSIGGERILTVLGPGKDFYVEMIKESDKTPAMRLRETYSVTEIEKARKRKYEDMTFETENLPAEDTSTSAENNMSLILYLTVAGKKVLFTGDAGTMGLYKAISYAIEKQIDLKTLDLFDVPHHGSKNNVSKGILDMIHAPIAVASCAVKGEPSHPSPMVMNALIRRGITPYSTKGTRLTYNPNTYRPDLSPATPTPFQPWVEV